MLIKVMYQNNEYGTVNPFLLDELIASGKIKKFLRSGGWATIGIDPIRGTGGHYKGPERRIELLKDGDKTKEQLIHEIKELRQQISEFEISEAQRKKAEDLLRIIEAFHKFRQQNGGYKLIIVGKPYSNYQAPEALVQKLELTGDVIFYGYAETEQLLELYQRAVAFIFASICEGFGIPILEAMSCGTPVITSNISAMPEIAGDAAIIVDPFCSNEIAAAMVNIVRNAGLRNILVKKGKQRVQQFSWDKAAQETLWLYESVAK